MLLDLTLAGLYGVTDHIGIEAELPLRMNLVSATFDDADGNRLDGFDSIHHRNETIFGIGDLVVAGRFGIIRPDMVPRWILDARVGMSLPTGNIEPNPFELGREGRDHQHAFFGSGTLDPVAAIETSIDLDAVQLAGWVNVRGALYENRYRYKASTRVGAGVGVMTRFGLDDWAFMLQPEVAHETPATWDGEAARNSGRTDLIATAGVFWSPVEDLTTQLLVRVPFYTHVVDGQLNIPVLVTLGASFGIETSDEHDHEHGGHDHDHDHSGHDHREDDREPGPTFSHEDAHQALASATGDIADVASGGESFVLSEVLVSGKVTVVDFWAEWCEPCHAITLALVELAGEHQNLAVRRVEVPDFDTPAALDHIPQAIGLPVVWIYDERGNRIATFEGTTSHEVRARLGEILGE